MSASVYDPDSPVRLELDVPGVARVILNRPQRKNAITGPFGQALAAAVTEAAGLAEVRVVLLQGADGAFCSGLDLKAFNADPPPDWLADFQTLWRGAHRALYDCPKPVVGALQRYAINGGAALALACDLLICGEAAYLQVGESQIGMAAPYNIAWLSLRHSEATVARLALPGERWTGPQLLAAGIASDCVADDNVLDAAVELATRLAGYPEAGLPRIKAGLRAAANASADEWFDRFTQASAGGTATRPSSMQTVNDR